MKALRLEIWVDTWGPFSGSLQIDTEMIDITSGRDSYKPDPKWEHVDKAGHWHAFTRDGKHPTLERYEKPIPCDGSCGGVCEGEGTSETRYRCRACGKRIKPNFVVDTPAFSPQRIPGRQSWIVHATTDVMLGTGDFTVRAVGKDRMWFGLARLLDVSMMSSGTSATCDYQLLGASELGERAA